MRDRRTLLFGAATMLALVAVFRVVPAWSAWLHESRAAAAEAMGQAARSDALLASLPESLDSLEARTARVLDVGSALLTGESPTEAASMLTALLGEEARQSLVRLDAIEVRVDTSKSKALPRVSVEVQATADVAGLASLLHGLEKGPTLLAVRRLAIRPQNMDSPADQVETLAIRLTVEGLALVTPPRDSR